MTVDPDPRDAKKGGKNKEVSCNVGRVLSRDGGVSWSLLDVLLRMPGCGSGLREYRYRFGSESLIIIPDLCEIVSLVPNER